MFLARIFGKLQLLQYNLSFNLKPLRLQHACIIHKISEHVNFFSDLYDLTVLEYECNFNLYLGECIDYQRLLFVDFLHID